jgi:UDP-N-acetylglucosamine 1-carboxyvinyltransferase
MEKENLKSNKALIVQEKQIPRGVVKVSGAKNAATRLQAAALLSDEKVTLTNFPTEIVDATYKLKFILKVGGDSRFDHQNELCITEPGKLSDEILKDYDYPIRTTYLLVPGLLKRAGIARIPYPGGCNIGKRKYDLHVMIWEKMGAEVEEKSDYIEVRANKLKGAEINFPISTIGGTESALLCGSIADGKTIIRNAYISPEIDNLINYLDNVGINIKVIGNSYIEVYGNNYIRGTSHEVISDRIEALTWIIYSVISGGDVFINNFPFEFMKVPLIHLRDAGVDYYKNSDSMYITSSCTPYGIQPFEIATGTYPGIISDMQPFFTLLGLKAHGISRIYDYRYPERTKYLEELSKYCPGALEWSNGKIIINGPVIFQTAQTCSTDLRGGMALVLAALLSENGGSTVNKVEMALRGYNRLEEKLKNLGIKITLAE